MQSPLTLIAAVLRAELFTAALIVSAVGGVAVWVTPMALEAMTPPEPALNEVSIEGDRPLDRDQVIDAVALMLESAYALAGASDDALLLWQTDARDRGALNPDEALLIAHSPTLLTLTAAYSEGASEKRLDPAELLTPSGARRFRASPGAVKRVIATGVSAVSVTTSHAAPGEADVALTLTWGASSDDAHDEAGASRTTLRVRMRRVEGVGR